MLAVSWDTVRLFLHVLAATVWVGGQLTLAFLVPPLRRLGAELPRAAARAFNRVAWPAFTVSSLRLRPWISTATLELVVTRTSANRGA